MPDVSLNAQLTLKNTQLDISHYPIILHNSQISSAAYCQQALRNQLAA